MTADFSRALARAMAQVRAQDPAAATATLQAALAGAPVQPRDEAEPAPRPERPRLARDAEDAEIVAPEAAPGTSGRPRRPLREVVELLRSGRAGLKDADRPHLDLQGLDLQGLDLQKLTLPSLNLQGLNLPGLDLPGARQPAPPLPGRARFEWRSHACAAGTRRYRLFVPSCPAAELRGLVVMLHGCTQGPDDFAAGTGMNGHAEAARLLVAYPEQPQSANASACWNWFDPAHQSRDAGEPAVLSDLARSLAAEFALPEGRVFVAGLSAGGAMAAVLAETCGDVFAAAGIHSGLPAGAARDVVSAFAAMRGQGVAARPGRAGAAARTIVFHGTADRTVSPANARAIVTGLGGTGEPETGTTAGRRWQRSRGADGRRACRWRPPPPPGRRNF